MLECQLRLRDCWALLRVCHAAGDAIFLARRPQRHL